MKSELTLGKGDNNSIFFSIISALNDSHSHFGSAMRTIFFAVMFGLEQTEG